MTKSLLVGLAVMLLLPSVSFAHDWEYGPYGGYSYYRYPYYPYAYVYYPYRYYRPHVYYPYAYYRYSYGPYWYWRGYWR